MILALPMLAKAADLEVAGWIPYWRDSEGIRDAREHLDELDAVYPFAFSVKQNGELEDLAGLDEREWERFIDRAEDENVEVMPTVMWSDGANIHRILSDRNLRESHVEAIAEMVEDGDYDGVNIDYEGKLAATKDYFSQFLEELKGEIGSKELSCTMEARTPPEDLYRTMPAVIEYANDYEEIAEHCDRVEIMAYDQQRADLSLNDARKGEPYMPVADADWVEKVVDLTLETIPANKVLLGIPTYGHHYTVTVAPDWYRDYQRIGALNIPDMLDVAEDYDVEPGRNSAGEMSFTYFPESSPFRLLRTLPVPEGTREGMEAAAQALLFTNISGMESQFNIGWYSDAGAIGDKVEIAENFGLKGIALFKIDGEEDDEAWELLED